LTDDAAGPQSHRSPPFEPPEIGQERFEGDLDDADEGTAPSHTWRTRASFAAGALVIGAAGFFGGAKWQDSRSSTESDSVVAGAPDGRIDGSRVPGGLQPPGSGSRAPGGGGGATTFGEITAVEGDVVTVEDAQGNAVHVVVSSDTGITISENGSIDDLAVGDSVLVQGTTDADGTVVAASISDGAGFGGGLGRLPGSTPSTSR
jgi:hypothetical protein